ncbi:uncharacterized protein LOC143910802 [Arctopsyche grandis]|uniref:uncharacterized protein LOC143910802 n=1 Tax=Arctopsyche grandis TaxID=121162 RepID=UPI00406D77E7
MLWTLRLDVIVRQDQDSLEKWVVLGNLWETEEEDDPQKEGSLRAAEYREYRWTGGSSPGPVARRRGQKQYVFAARTTLSFTSRGRKARVESSKADPPAHILTHASPTSPHKDKWLANFSGRDICNWKHCRLAYSYVVKRTHANNPDGLIR